jgi:hypothetical protein
MNAAKLAAKIGAGFYVLWGTFHLFAAKSAPVPAPQSAGRKSSKEGPTSGRNRQPRCQLPHFCRQLSSQQFH